MLRTQFVPPIYAHFITREIRSKVSFPSYPRRFGEARWDSIQQIENVSKSVWADHERRRPNYIYREIGEEQNFENREIRSPLV